MNGTAIHSPDASIHDTHAPVQVTKIDISDRTWAILSFGLALAAIVCACWSFYQTSIAERESRMLEYYVLEMDAKLIKAGVEKPEDSVSKRLNGR